MHAATTGVYSNACRRVFDNTCYPVFWKHGYVPQFRCSCRIHNTTFTYSQNGANDSITGQAAVSLRATGNSGMQVLGGTWDANGNGQSVDVSVIYFGERNQC